MPTTAGTSSPITVTGLTNSQQYQARVRANTGTTQSPIWSSWSAWSAPFTPTAPGVIPPGAPQSVAGTLVTDGMSIAFAAPASDGGSAIIEYQAEAV